MGRKNRDKKNGTSLASLASKSSPILEFQFDEPLFQVNCHPEKPIIITAIATGHMFCYQYDPKALQKIVNSNELRYSNLEEAQKQQKTFWKVVRVPQDIEEHSKESKDANEKDAVKLLWKTRRHKGSVRGLCFDSDGSHVFSVGVDNVLKKANSETGKVVKKITLPEAEGKHKYTKLIKSATHPLLLLGDEGGNIFVLDSNTLEVKNTIRKIHNGDAINDILHFVGKSIYKFISLGQTTLAYWDSRESNEGDFSIAEDDQDTKRKVLVSDDQEDEMLCGTFVNPDNGDVLVCGMGEGLLTVWKPKKNDLVDQLTRIPICRGESIECVISSFQDDNCVYCGCSNGNIYKVNVKMGKVVEIRKHSSLDEVAFIDLDYEYRLLSGGMEGVKLWEFVGDEDESGTDESIDNDDTNSLSPSYLEENAKADSSPEFSDGISSTSSEEFDSKDDESDVDDGIGSSDEEKTLIGLSKEELLAELDKDLQSSDDEQNVDTRNHSKRINKESTDKPIKKKLKKQLTNKQLKNLQRHEHGIRKFEGL